MSELEVDIAVFTIVVATFTTIYHKINGRKELKRLKEELIEAKASLSSAEAEINDLKIAFDEKYKKSSG